MKRLLLVSPHFPPDGSAGTHRARVLAPHLPAAGWHPTVLTVDPRDYEGTLDRELAAMLPPELSVERVRALSPRWTRTVGVGDLGLRAFAAIRRRAFALARAERFDAVFVTTYPIFPALVGPALSSRFRMPFVLDLQDPWTGAWGLTVGAGPGGTVDLKSRGSRALAMRLERRVLPRADAVTGVSSGLLEELTDRYPVLRSRPTLALPIGIDPRDVAWVRAHAGPRAGVDTADGRFHLCAVGTLQPLGIPPLRALLAALANLRARFPESAARLVVHFVGTSNEMRADARPRVEPHARELGVSDLIVEHAPRVGYAEALRVVTAASAVLVLGSTEPRYTASKIGPALASGRPLVVVAHADSDMLRALPPGPSPSVKVLPFREPRDVAEATRALTEVLAGWIAAPPPPRGIGPEVEAIGGPALAKQLGALLDGLVSGHA
jgi:hypothetical protein